jgi:hypothetical protein
MKFKDVAHLYIGCKCKVEDFGEVSYDEILHGIKYNSPLVGGKKFDVTSAYHFKPILRPLSDMTDEEFDSMKDEMIGETVIACTIYNRKLVLENRVGTNSLYFKDGIALMKRYFDLFNLIGAGEAIDATTLENNPYK